MRSRFVLPILAVLAAPAVAIAGPPVVLAVDGDTIYVGVGGQDGVAAGAELELLHAVIARDPATGAKLRDEFAIGALTVERAGDHVAIAHADPEVAGRVAAGDHVRLIGAPTALRDPWLARLAEAEAPQVATTHDGGAPGPGPGPSPSPSPSPKPRADVTAADTEAVHATWRATLGTPLAERVARWRAFLADHADTAYATAIRAEIASLERQQTERDAAIAAATAPLADRAERIAALAAQVVAGASGPLAIDPPTRATAGEPIELAFLIRDPHRVANAELFVRAPGAEGFKRIELQRDGDAYLRATIPAEVVTAPEIAWFVELTDADGSLGGEIGSAASPRTIAVDAVVKEQPPDVDRSRVTLAVDYVDFDGGFGDGYDQYVQAELDFTYRFIKPIYAFRIGFGTLSGVGGPKDVIDEAVNRDCVDADGFYQCRRITFNYAYIELEHRFSSAVAVMLRPQAGLVATDSMPGSTPTRCTDSSNTADCAFAAGYGLRGRLRLGDERSTNLVLGVGFTKGVGTVLEARYHWLPAPVLPVELSVEVTDQPVPEDFGVRLIGDVGWRGLSWFYPSIRMSMQARDIDHTGFSGGAALNFDW